MSFYFGMDQPLELAAARQARRQRRILSAIVRGGGVLAGPLDDIGGRLGLEPEKLRADLLLLAYRGDVSINPGPGGRLTVRSMRRPHADIAAVTTVLS